MPKCVNIVEEKDLLNELKLKIQSIASSCISLNGSFKIGLSGGSLVQMLEKCLPGLETQWESWRLFFCDERVVSFENPDSTYGLYKNLLLEKVPLKDEQFITIDPGLSAGDAAVDYENKLRSHFQGSNGFPEFDLLLLGLGPDGHTCSLFPGHELLNENKLWVAAITDSPKPPPCRITLTLPVLNNAKNIVFAISGKGKSSIVKRIFDGEDLPVNRISPISGDIFWLLDKEAASDLSD